MSSRSKVTHAIQVFPFLAVLVCTMGALIFLLLLMTRQVRKREEAFAAHENDQRALASLVATSMPPVSPDVEAADSATPQIFVFPQQPEHEGKSWKLPDEAYEIASAERSREQAELTSQWKLKTRKLKDGTEEKQQSVARQKLQVDAAIKRLSKLTNEVEDLEEQLEQFSTDPSAATATTAELAEQRSIDKQIAEMKRRLRVAKAAEANGENDKFQVVPFDPKSGTTRRPILIECTASGIRFLPEGVLITPADLSGFTPRVNPIAAGTGALINYWNDWKSKQRQPKNEPDPYPLLLVRPDGVVAYYVAMKMLEPIRTTHGYELIEESTSLQLPEVDLEAKAACETAVQRLLSERDHLRGTGVSGGIATNVPAGRPFAGSGGRNLEGASNGVGPTTTGGTNGSRSGPGPSSNSYVFKNDQFTMRDVDEDDEELAANGWERIDKSPVRSRPQNGREVAGNSDGGKSEPTRGRNSGQVKPQAGGSPRGIRETSRNRNALASDAASSFPVEQIPGDAEEIGSETAKVDRVLKSMNGPQPNGNSSKGMMRAVSTVAEPKDVFTSNVDVPPLITNNGVAGPNDSAGAVSNQEMNGVIGTQERPSSPGFTSHFQEGETLSQPRSQYTQRLNGLAGASPPGFDTTSGAIGGRIPAAGETNSNAVTRNASGDPAVARRGSMKRQRIGSETSGADEIESDSADEGDDSDQEFDEDPDESGLGRETNSGSRQQSGARSGRAVLSDDGSSSLRTSRGNRPSATSRPANKRDKSDNPDRQLEPEMLAGRHWGYSESGSSIGLEREVRVDVSNDKIIINERHEILVGQGESTQETFELFVTAIDKSAKEWGRPPQGFFWAPRLKFIVKPDATGKYEQVNKLMSRAGLSTAHEFAKTADAVEFGRDSRPAKRPTPKAARKFGSGVVQ